MIISPKIRMIILFLIAFAASWLIYRPILKIAKDKNMTDNPDARKLQKVPVPVLGGIAVFFGVVVGLCYFKTMLNYVSLFPLLGAMVIMLYVGTIDDIADLSPWLRIALEIGVSLLLIYGNHRVVIDFDGLWGINRLSLWVAIPLTVLMCVGLVNAMNMIDGVDGLVSAMCIFECTCFGLMFFLAHDYSFAALCAVLVGALLPFVFHNVFGRETKMFIGDGGTMMVGIAMAAMVIELLCGRFSAVTYQPWMDFNLVAMCLAVMAMPVSDTLRVMMARIFKGVSPFKADNNHFHHLLIRSGFSHLEIVAMMVFLNVLIVLVWLIAWWAGASAGWQLAAVLLTALVADLGVASFLKIRIAGHGDTKSMAVDASRGMSDMWMKIQSFVDRF